MGDHARGFIGSLFDLSFTSFVTTRVVKVLYVLTIVVLVIGYIVIAVAIFSGGGDRMAIDSNGNLTRTGGGNTGFGILWLLILGPLLLFLYTLLYRVIYEFVIVVFRIYENTSDQLELTRRAMGGTPGSPPPSEGSP